MTKATLQKRKHAVGGLLTVLESQPMHHGMKQTGRAPEQELGVLHPDPQAAGVAVGCRH